MKIMTYVIKYDLFYKKLNRSEISTRFLMISGIVLGFLLYIPFFIRNFNSSETSTQFLKKMAFFDYPVSLKCLIQAASFLVPIASIAWGLILSGTIPFCRLSSVRLSSVCRLSVC